MKNLNNLLLVLLLNFTVLNEIVFASEIPEIVKNSNNTKSFKPLVLKGKVEHSAKLPALPNYFETGKEFNKQILACPKSESKWFKIPYWFAGVFESNSSTINKIQDYASGKTIKTEQTIASRAQEIHGYQNDAKGDIWHYYLESGSSKSEQALQCTYSNIDWYGPVFVDEQKIVMRFLATSLIVDKRNGLIVDSYRREDIKTYEPLDSHHISVKFSSKSFDKNGNPRDKQDGFAIYTLTRPFRAIEIENPNELNYRLLFIDYLKSQGLHNLIP